MVLVCRYQNFDHGHKQQLSCHHRPSGDKLCLPPQVEEPHVRMVSSCTSSLACCLAHCPFQENDVGFSRYPSGFSTCCRCCLEACWECST